jgi:N-acetylneuraminate synthase/N,N'-diacetyllegionaminate synthase
MTDMRIQDRTIGGDAPFVIAEAGVNHDGDVGAAHRLISIAAESGADAVKFQTFAPSSLVAAGAGTTPYQQRAGGVQTQAEMLAALTLPQEAWVELSADAREQGLIFLSTPFDLNSAELLAELGVPALKTGSGELTNLPFLRALAGFGLPLLISTGMANWDEVDSAVAATSGATEIALFHCVSAYPAPMAECNLRVIPAMQERYSVPVGWSDHTLGLTTAVAATSLGARLFEKHFTFDASAPGPDHAASLEPDQLRTYVSTVRETAVALGDGVKRRVPSEEENAPLVRRSWHAARDLAAGTALGEADVVALRPESGISVAVDLAGATLARPVSGGQPLLPEDLTTPPGGRPA